MPILEREEDQEEEGILPPPCGRLPHRPPDPGTQPPVGGWQALGAGLSGIQRMTGAQE